MPIIKVVVVILQEVEEVANEPLRVDFLNIFDVISFLRKT